MTPLIWTSATAAIVFWVVFAAWGTLEWYPIIAERRASTPLSPSDNHTNGTGALLLGAIYGGYLLAFLAGSIATDAVLPGSGWIPFWSGIGLIGGGIVLRQWAIHVLGRSFTRQLKTRPGQTVISRGPYRIVRHPSYLGGYASCIGVGVALGNWISIVAVIVCSAVGFVWRIRTEEEMLRTQLGASYQAYAQSTRYRLVPGVW